MIFPAVGMPDFHFDGEPQANLDDQATGARILTA